MAVIVGYPLLFETLTAGRTPGKMALGLRVVRDDGGPTRVRHALVRALVGVVEIWLCLGVIAILTSLVSTRGKRLGDLAAGTVVVRDRVPEQAAPILAMPPQLAAWAAGLELSRLPDPLALATRQMLGRAEHHGAAARQQMAQRMAYDVSQVVSPPPPAGCPPEPTSPRCWPSAGGGRSPGWSGRRRRAAPAAPLPYVAAQPAAAAPRRRGRPTPTGSAHPPSGRLVRQQDPDRTRHVDRHVRDHARDVLPVSARTAPIHAPSTASTSSRCGSKWNSREQHRGATAPTDTGAAPRLTNAPYVSPRNASSSTTGAPNAVASANSTSATSRLVETKTCATSAARALGCSCGERLLDRERRPER